MGISLVGEHLSALGNYLLGIVIVGSNGLLLAAFARCKELRQKEFCIIVGVGFFDLLFGLSSISTGLCDHYRLVTDTKHDNMSLAKHMLFDTSKYTYPMANLAYLALSVDRLVAVFSTTYAQLSGTYALYMLIGCAAYSMITVPWSAYYLWRHWDLYLPAWSRGSIPPTILNKIAPMTCILSAYLSVILYLLVVIGHRKMVSDTKTENVRNRQLARQKRLNKTVGILVLFTFFFDALPLTGVLIVSKHHPLARVFFALTRVNSFVNVCVLYWRQNKIRNAIRLLFGKKQNAVAGANLTGAGSTHRRIHRGSSVKPAGVAQSKF